MIGETGERKSAVAIPDGKSRKKKKTVICFLLNKSIIVKCLQHLYENIEKNIEPDVATKGRPDIGKDVLSEDEKSVELIIYQVI